MNVLLLPGLDGTGDLFRDLSGALGERVPHRIVRYPTDRAMSYDELVTFVETRLGPGPSVVVAESFSGPVGVGLAARYPGRIAGLVLAASFVRNPLPASMRWMRFLAARPTFAMSPPEFVIRWLLTGFDATGELVERVRRAVTRVGPDVLAHRVRSIANVECSEELGSLEIPVTYVRAERDRLVGARGAAQVAAVVPHAEVVELPGAHLVLQVRAVESAAIVEQFREGLL